MPLAWSADVLIDVHQLQHQQAVTCAAASEDDPRQEQTTPTAVVAQHSLKQQQVQQQPRQQQQGHVKKENMSFVYWYWYAPTSGCTFAESVPLMLNARRTVFCIQPQGLVDLHVT